MAHGSWLIMNGRWQQCPPSTLAISHEPSAMTDLCNLRLAVRREPLAADAIFLRERLALGRIARGAHPRLMQHFVLGDLRLVEVADFGDGRLLFVGDGARLDAGVRIVLAKTLHRELERGFERFVVSHGLNGTPKGAPYVNFGRHRCIRAPYITSLPPRTHVVPPTVTVRSVKKFQRTYPPVTMPPSSVLSPSDRRTTPAP